MLGVILGGALTGFLSWRWVFFAKVPIVLLIFVGSIHFVRSRPMSGARSTLDIEGAVLGTAAVLALVGGLSQIASASPRTNWRVPTLIGLSAVLLLIFVKIERSTPNALIPFDVFRSRQFTSALIVAGLTYVAALMLAFTLTLFVQQGLGYSPQATGLLFVPVGLGGMVGGSMAAFLVRRGGLWRTTTAALIVMALGTAIVIGLGMAGSAAWLAIGYGVATIGVLGSLVANTIAATSALAHRFMGLVGGLLNTSQFVGGAVGTALAGVLDSQANQAAYARSLLASLGIVFIAVTISAAAGYGAAHRSVGSEN